MDSIMNAFYAYLVFGQETVYVECNYNLVSL